MVVIIVASPRVLLAIGEGRARYVISCALGIKSNTSRYCYARKESAMSKTSFWGKLFWNQLDRVMLCAGVEVEGGGIVVFVIMAVAVLLVVAPAAAAAAAAHSSTPT